MSSMNTSSPPLERLSSSDRKRQLEESIAQAMARCRSEHDAVLANTARLRALREAREAHEAREAELAPPPPPRKTRKIKS